MKRFPTFLSLQISMLLLCLPFTVSAQYFEQNGIVYGITSPDEQTVEVVPSYTLLNTVYSGAVTIPQTVEHEGIVYTVTALGESAFYGCSDVTALTLPATISSFGSYCFYDCRFTSLQLPDSLRTIADYAFLYSNVASLHLPAGFVEYGECAFWARNLTSLTVDDANPHYRSIDGWLYSKDSLTLCIVPDGVTGTINVPSYVRHIGKMAFGFNSHITTVTLPEGLRSIGDFAFNCCSVLDGIVIPSTVARIGVCPFSYCPQMDNLVIAPGNSHYVMDGMMIYSSGFDTLVSCHKSAVSVTLHPNLKVLGGFENNTWLQDIDIPESVTDITDNCFNGCSFTSIALPTRMKSIGAHAFSLNDQLATVTMPQSLLTMGKGAFENCLSLSSIVIPDSLRVIPENAFNSDINLSSITWNNDVEEIGDYAFWAMSFYSQTHITSLDFPASLKKIGEAAFGSDQNHLRYVNFSGQVDSLGEAVFYKANLYHVYFSVGVPPAVKGYGPLYGLGRIDRIYIPCGGTETWTADSYWGQFADIMVENCDGVDGIESDNIKVYARGGRIIVDGSNGETVVVYDLLGRQVTNSTLRNGVYLVKVGDRPAKKVVVLE